MRQSRIHIATTRRLKSLADVYANLFRPELFEDDFLDAEYAMSPRQAFELLAGSFRRNYIEEIGERAALRVLQTLCRPYLVHKYGLRTVLLTCFCVLLYAHGPSTAVLLQTLVYLVTRPLAWTNRGRGARSAERVLRYHSDVTGGTRAIRRALHSERSHIPARALHSRQWRKHLEELLPVEEDVREIALKLSDQYEGSLAELTETSRALAR